MDPDDAALPVPERMSIPSLERDASGAAVAVAALHFRPEPRGARTPIPSATSTGVPHDRIA
jgi:hypothetical protein